MTEKPRHPATHNRVEALGAVLTIHRIGGRRLGQVWQGRPERLAGRQDREEAPSEVHTGGPDVGARHVGAVAGYRLR